MSMTDQRPNKSEGPIERPMTVSAVAAIARSRLDPAVCSTIPREDVQILRDREIEELRLLFDACLAWGAEAEAGNRDATDRITRRDRLLLDAILRASKHR